MKIRNFLQEYLGVDQMHYPQGVIIPLFQTGSFPDKRMEQILPYIRWNLDGILKAILMSFFLFERRSLPSLSLPI